MENYMESIMKVNIIKQRGIVFCCVLMSVLSVFADEPQKSETRYYRHEVNVSRTGMFLPTSQWKDYEDMVYKTLSIEKKWRLSKLWKFVRRYVV